LNQKNNTLETSFNTNKCANIIHGCENTKKWNKFKLINETEWSMQFQQIFCEDCMKFNTRMPMGYFFGLKTGIIDQIRKGKI
jgi:hypothetical protein